MFELRWLEKETGKQLQNEFGFFYLETVKILQYRELQHNGSSNITINKWSEWKDVPTYVESTGAIK